MVLKYRPVYFIGRRKETETKQFADGDIYLNPFFGDMWIVDGQFFIKINDGYKIDIDDPDGFIKVGHVDGVVNKHCEEKQNIDFCDGCTCQDDGCTGVSCIRKNGENI